MERIDHQRVGDRSRQQQVIHPIDRHELHADLLVLVEAHRSGAQAGGEHRVGPVVEECRVRPDASDDDRLAALVAGLLAQLAACRVDRGFLLVEDAAGDLHL